jgi:hypothetical protein
MEFTSLVASDQELSPIYIAGLAGAEKLPAMDADRFQFLMLTVTHCLESAFFQREAGVLNEQQRAGFRRVRCGVATTASKGSVR